MRTALAALTAVFAVSSALAQGTKTRPNPQAYAAVAEVRGAVIAAENFGHSLTSDHGSLLAGDYLVVEIAVFPKGPARVQFAASEFTARINGKKYSPDSAGMVSASIKYSDWTQHGRLSGGAALGDAGVALGQPAPAGRFPGDPNDPSRHPRSPRVDTGTDPNVPQREALPVDEVVQRSSLPEALSSGAVSGFVYFPFKGKVKKIKSLEILYEGPYGEATLRLL